MERAAYQKQAAAMADLQAGYLLQHAARTPPETAIERAARLVRDYVHHLDQPTRAVRFALQFHPLVERWSVWGGWAAALDEVLAVVAHDGALAEHVQLLTHRSKVARLLGKLDLAQELATAALELAEAHAEAALTVAARNQLGLIALSRDDLPAAIAHWSAVQQAADYLTPLEQGHVCLNLGLIAVQQGQLADAQRHFETGLAHYEALGNPLHIAKAHCNLADLDRRQARLRAVPPSLLAARDLFRQLDARYDYALAENEIGYIHLQLGEFAAARDAFGAALVAAQQIGALSVRALVLSNLGELEVTTADWTRAAATLDEARTLAELCQKPLLIAAIDVDRGRMCAALGDLPGALAHWTAAYEVQLARGARFEAQHTARLLDELRAPPP